jgi:hypothetical protein
VRGPRSYNIEFVVNRLWKANNGGDRELKDHTAVISL